MMGIGSIANTGLKAAMTNMEAISNNISNANTVGFKKSNVNFADIYAGGFSQSNYIGFGVKTQSVTQDFSMGRIELTDRGLDLSLSNDGFFVQKNGAGQVSYTRAGRLELDKDNYFIGTSGRLQGYPAVNGSVTPTGTLVDLKVPQTQIPAKDTSNVNLAINLNASAEPPVLPFSDSDPATYNYRTDTTIYDSLGQSYPASVYYIKTADNTWSTQVYLADQNIGIGNISFESNGSLLSASGMDNLSWNPTSGAQSPASLTLTFPNATQYASDNKTNKNEQDGYPAGIPTGFNIDDNGNINVYYTNGKTQLQGQIAIAKFQAPQGLARSENMSWQATSESGDPLYDQDASIGSIHAGTLEYSNVDLTEELVKLMGAQHDFQANAQVAQTYNQVLQTIEKI
jgi:flagellar hook protein FlgE